MKTGMWLAKIEAGEAAWPPCRAACPAHTDCRGYAALIAVGRYEEALALIRERAPLAASLGRICHHPCEEKCRRAYVDQAVSIRALKRFAADVARGKPHPRPDLKAPTGKRVAVIGGGPAGLTAAADLAKAGHSVEIYEKKSAAGGALFYGVPKYRLPKDVLAWDVSYVESLGVDIRLNAEIDGEAARALVEGSDAVVVTTGLPISRGLPIPGADATGVHLALPFLEAANAGHPPALEGEVIVIGGGNVAIDVARTALRVGASRVSLYCLEGPSKNDLPAFSWEIEEAIEEGVQINPSWGPVEITTEGERVAGIKFKRCTRVFDDAGRFNPTFDETETTEAEADAVIFAIGQASDASFLAGIADLDERGRLIVDSKTMRTSNPKVFAAGELITGPGSAIAAIASGHRVAEAVDAYLSGRELEVYVEPPAAGELPKQIVELIAKKPRAQSEVLSPSERLKGFSEVEATYSEEAAVREALRCLSCGNGAIADEVACAGCLTCVRVCPFDAPSVERTASMEIDSCQACGLCAAECPAKAVEIGAADLRLLPDLIAGKELTAFVCREAAILPERLSSPDRQLIGVPCAARIDGATVLKAFEAGSRGVLIIGCSEGGGCRYGAGDRLAGRVLALRKLLDEVGIGGQKLGLSTEPNLEIALEGFAAEVSAGQAAEGGVTG